MTTANAVKSEPAADYTPELSGVVVGLTDNDAILARAREIILARFERGETLKNPKESHEYLQLLLGGYEHEVFGMITLDNRNRVIAWHELFRGTIDGSSVYPREVVKTVLMDNAAAVILSHNHPSGVTEPSQADIRITERLRKALALVDVRVLDHIIVGEGCSSLAEQGLV